MTSAPGAAPRLWHPLIDEVDAWAETLRRRTLDQGPLVVVPPAGRLGDAMRQMAAAKGYRVVEVADAARSVLRAQDDRPQVTGPAPALCVRCALTELTT